MASKYMGFRINLLVDALAERFPDRGVHVVGDNAYGCGAFAGLGPDMTMTTRARSNAVFCEPAPPRTGKRGRPRVEGERIGTPGDIDGPRVFRTAAWWLLCCLLPVQVLVVDLEWGLVAES